MCQLPAVLPVISIAWRIGTPACTRPEKVRDQRASAILWITSPILAGIFSFIVSHCRWPIALFFHFLKPTTVADRAGEQQVPLAGHDVRGGHADLRDHRQLAVEVLEDVLEDRDQERDQREHHDQREDPDHHRVGHRRAHLAAQRVRLLELVRDPHQRLLEHSRRLTGARHRDVELVEDVRVLLERVGERDSRLDVLPDLAEDLLQLLVLGLLLEHVERRAGSTYRTRPSSPAAASSRSARAP